MYAIILTEDFSQDTSANLVTTLQEKPSQTEFIQIVENYLKECEDNPEFASRWKLVEHENDLVSVAHSDGMYVEILDHLVKIHEDEDGFGGQRNTIFGMVEIP